MASSVARKEQYEKNHAVVRVVASLGFALRPANGTGQKGKASSTIQDATRYGSPANALPSVTRVQNMPKETIAIG